MSGHRRGALGLDALPRRRLRRQPADLGARDARRHGARRGAGRGRGTPGCLVRGPAAAATGPLPQRAELRADVLRGLRAAGGDRWRGAVVAVPLWIKATLALTHPGDRLRLGPVPGAPAAAARRGRRRPRRPSSTAWLQYFLIILMASATASVIGADEIVGRANRVIATDSRPAFLIATYVYVSGWFLASGLLASAAGASLIRARRAGGAEPQALGEGGDSFPANRRGRGPELTHDFAGRIRPMLADKYLRCSAVSFRDTLSSAVSRPSSRRQPKAMSRSPSPRRRKRGRRPRP